MIRPAAAPSIALTPVATVAAAPYKRDNRRVDVAGLPARPGR
jgi:hypothetical protein